MEITQIIIFGSVILVGVLGLTANRNARSCAMLLLVSENNRFNERNKR